MRDRLVAIVGATATGKTALAIALAERLDGEIVNADSRQVYVGMDIGTAKPTADEQRQARHWLIDVAPPDETFTLATYLDLSNRALDDIRSRGRLPIIAGGTGQYVWALLEGWRVPRVPPDNALRAELETFAKQEGGDALFAVLRSEDPESAASIDPRNVRRVIRAIEVTRKTGRPFSAWRETQPQGPAPAIIGLRIERDALYRRIDLRVDAMIEAGLVDEVRALNAGGYGCELASMNSIGYRQICEHLAGACSLNEAVARIKTETHRLARMQHTWFRQTDPRILWFDALAPSLIDGATAAIEQELASE
jgi:tRNA dimethylallyltransferase